jgi:fatty acid desaturase
MIILILVALAVIGLGIAATLAFISDWSGPKRPSIIAIVYIIGVPIVGPAFYLTAGRPGQ